MEGKFSPPGGHESWECASVVVPGEKETPINEQEHMTDYHDSHLLLLWVFASPWYQRKPFTAKPLSWHSGGKLEIFNAFSLKFFSSYLSGATIAFQRAELQFFLLVGFSEEMSQWRGWGGGEEQDASASLRDKVGSLSKIHTYYMW